LKNARAFQHIRFLTQSKTPNNTSNNEHKQNTKYMQKKSETRKQFTESRPSIGLGDTIQKVTKTTGIELATKFLLGEDCGCDARKHKLNKLFPNRKPLCMTEGEYDWWTHFKSVNSQTLSPMEANEGCGNLVKGIPIQKNLQAVYLQSQGMANHDKRVNPGL
jgi:hypothetical protein